MLSLKSFYDELYAYEKSVDIETIEALAQCVLRNLTREELRATVRGKVFEETLDVGCGIGHNLIVLLENARMGSVVGVDIATGAVRIAKKRIVRRGFEGKSDFVVCDAQFLPFRESGFDLVVCTEVLEHLADDRKGISEISRVTRAEGKVFLSTASARDSFRRRTRKVSTETLYRPNQAVNMQYFGLQTGGDLRRYEFEDLVGLLDARKLRVVRHWFNGRFFYSLSVKLNYLILSLGWKLLRMGEVRGDILRDSASSGNLEKIRRLLKLYSRVVIPLSNAILSLDLVFLRFDYGGNLTVDARFVP